MIVTMVLFIFTLIAWILPVTIKTKGSVHMLQVNSYRNERYIKWMGSHRTKVFLRLEVLYALPLVLHVITDSVTVSLGAAIAVFVLLFFNNLSNKPEEKKSLVYTPRVQRLLGATYIIYGLTASVSISVAGFFSIFAALFILVLAAVFPYYIVLLANTINRPIEARISRRFINDAKRLLKASPGLTVIGITGTVAGANVKHFVQTVLSSKYNVLMTPENHTSKFGIARTINEQLKSYHDIFIAEMSAEQEGEIREICDLVTHKYGILTDIYAQIPDTLENMKKTKYEIVETLPEQEGAAFLNIDDENIMSWEPQNPCRKIYYGIDREDADLRASNIKFSGKGMSFTVTTADGKKETFITKLLGRHHIYNILAAAAVGLEMGLSLKQMAGAVKKMAAVPHNLELKRSSGNITMIDDSYNSNPVGSKAAIDVLGHMAGYRILITPGIIETGGNAYEINKEWAGYSADKCDYIILVGKKQTEPLQDGLKEAGYPDQKLYVAENLQDAMQHMYKMAPADSIVLLENDHPETD
ncbi:Mur ligase family protein [Salipaludibacillus aurantiacus]|uniref:UDP-N-acetylmuramoyl-tripeptide--D-alanyl-D-alanine ligase n=1 Tax=Salipaludibacillus aurantiacus TaxID=1601833 RepID=A0A1H9WKE8_9BACI|nr:UDP-N-acetylmuramoyl-tripeptide--D-alanyl-D-alanine ligase [Salipaludibacillus aurantiacus]SES33933.1 UDP-N-acetylmuramoyl-tripeptide--D-alanyl-D-alanine ligase [Salipaludibacillus aurantiacus]